MSFDGRFEPVSTQSALFRLRDFRRKQNHLATEDCTARRLRAAQVFLNSYPPPLCRSDCDSPEASRTPREVSRLRGAALPASVSA